MQALATLTNEKNRTSVTGRLRRKRFAHFLTLFETLPKPVHILDIGGLQSFWETMDFADRRDLHITLLNIRDIPTTHRNFTSLVGDATAMPQFANNEFDIAFSNSVIEHVGTDDAQAAMAREVQRVAQRYYIQTPNYYFPIEPHVLVPGFQFMPVPLRIQIVKNFKTGRMRKRYPTDEAARERVMGLNLLTKKRLLKIFSGAELYVERYMGLEKSFIAYNGW